MKDDSGPAFPLPWAPRTPGETLPPMPPHGMTLRDYFAGQALAGLLANEFYMREMARPGNKGVPAPKVCYEMADAMLEARKK